MGTKWYNDNHKNEAMRIRYTDTPIPIGAARLESEDRPKVYCPECRFDTVIKDEDGYRCTRSSCGHVFNIKRADEKVETGIIVETDNMDVNAETLVSDKVPDVLEAYYGNSKPEYRGGLAELHNRGIHITSYAESDGSGRVTRSYSESSNSSSGTKTSTPRPTREGKEE